MKLMKKATALLLICVMLSAFGALCANAKEEVAVVASQLNNVEVYLNASFNNWQDVEMTSDDNGVLSYTAELAEGSYQFTLLVDETEFGHPGTIKDTTVLNSENGWLLSDSINAKCTLIATGGSYEFRFDTSDNRLSVIKDGFIPENNDSDKLIVNAGDASCEAFAGDTITYTVSLEADKLFEDIQTILSFDSSKLELCRVESEESSACCPNIADIIYNSDHEGAVALNASNLEGYDFTAEQIYLTLDFTVIGTGETNLEFTTQEMTAVDETAYYSYSKKVADGAVFSETLAVDSAVVLPERELKFASVSLTLYDDISINFKVDKTLFTEAGYENPYVEFVMGDTEVTVSDFTDSGTKLVFDFDSISPANVNDTVYATLCAEFEGTIYKSDVLEYSVATYCYNMLSKYPGDDYASLRTLLVDLLNYGTAAQIYTNHNTENLANTALTAEQAQWGTQEKPQYSTVQNKDYAVIENPTAAFRSVGLNLEKSITLRFKIQAENVENLTVVVETDKYIWHIPATDFEALADGGYYVYFSGLNAAQMKDTVYVTVCEGDKAVSNTLSYSIESYACSKQTSTDEKLTSVLETMIKYGNSAKVFAG